MQNYLQRFGIKGCSVSLTWHLQLAYSTLSPTSERHFTCAVMKHLTFKFDLMCKLVLLPAVNQNKTKLKAEIALLHQGLLLKYLKHLQNVSNKPATTLRYCTNATSKAKHYVSPSSVWGTWTGNSENGEHIDLNVFQIQTGPDKVVITVGRVCTIT